MTLVPREWWVIALTSILGLFGVAPDPLARPASEPVGTVVLSISQASMPGGDTSALTRMAEPGSPVILDTEADRDAWLSRQGDLDLSVIADADLTQVELVVGAYHRCMEASTVIRTDTGDLVFAVSVPERHQETLCVWAPYTVDVWSVPRA